MFRPITRLQWIVDAVLAVLFAVLILPMELVIQEAAAPPSWALTVLVLGFTAALAVRRWSPLLSLAIAWAAAIAQMALGFGPRPMDLAIFAVLYVTAAYGTTLVFWLGFGSAILGSVVITAYILIVQSSEPLSLSALPAAIAILIAAMFALLLAWTTGALVRTAFRARDSRIAREQAQAVAAAEVERARIARDMHDVVAHSLAVVIAQADGARYSAAVDPEAAKTALATISTTARSALSDVRLLLTQLRHSQGEGPQPTIADLEALYAQVRSAGVRLEVTVDPAPPGEPPASVQLAVYRILQEALTNALRHGNGGTVAVHLSWLPDRVDLSVRNAARAAQGVGGHGLIGMRERAQLVGGTISTGTEGGDFVVRGELPIGPAQ